MSRSEQNDKHQLISQSELDAWLDGLAKVQTLIAPRDVSGVVLYRAVAGSSEILKGFGKPMLSVKDVLFPPTEQLMTIKKTGTEIQLNESLPENKAIVFGVRPCDARGVTLLDALFLGTEPVDPYYARRRANTTFIGLACKEMGPTCFCTSLGGSPDDPTGVDIMVHPINDGYGMEAISDKGHTLISEAGWSENVFGGHTLDDNVKQFPVLNKGEWPRHFDDDYWTKVSERCLSCRACAYVCPTCRCFAVRDEMVNTGEFERIRCWDSCTGENYRLVAGGHKPRPEKGERLRNRFFCKFFYYPGQIGLSDASACTGCGRCIDVCPVGVDITEILQDLGGRV